MIWGFSWVTESLGELRKRTRGQASRKDPQSQAAAKVAAVAVALDPGGHPRAAVPRAPHSAAGGGYPQEIRKPCTSCGPWSQGLPATVLHLDDAHPLQPPVSLSSALQPGLSGENAVGRTQTHPVRPGECQFQRPGCGEGHLQGQHWESHQPRAPATIVRDLRGRSVPGAPQGPPRRVASPL